MFVVMKPAKEERITIRIDKASKEELEKLAEKADRNLADYIRIKLKEIVRNEKNDKKTD
jgi:antitoxin component of RelBE/YafQ-DinJ toxin-antitoxin module